MRPVSALASMRVAALCAVGVALGVPAHGAELEAAPAGLEGREIARRAEAAMRADRSLLEAAMLLQTRDGEVERTLRFRLFDDRAGDRAYVQVLAPSGDAGTVLLKLPPNLWMHEPSRDQTTRIAPTLLHEPWLGSALGIDDVVRASDMVDDYEHRLLGVDPHPDEVVGRRAYVVDYAPRSPGPALWGRIVAWIDCEWSVPLRQEFFDADGTLRRVIRFGGIREVQQRHFPFVWVVRSTDDPRHETRVEVEEAQFDPEFDDSIFSTRHLKAFE